MLSAHGGAPSGGGGGGGGGGPRPWRSGAAAAAAAAAGGPVGASARARQRPPTELEPRLRSERERRSGEEAPSLEAPVRAAAAAGLGASGSRRCRRRRAKAAAAAAASRQADERRREEGSQRDGGAGGAGGTRQGRPLGDEAAAAAAAAASPALTPIAAATAKRGPGAGELAGRPPRERGAGLGRSQSARRAANGGAGRAVRLEGGRRELRLSPGTDSAARPQPQQASVPLSLCRAPFHRPPGPRETSSARLQEALKAKWSPKATRENTTGLAGRRAGAGQSRRRRDAGRAAAAAAAASSLLPRSAGRPSLRGALQDTTDPVGASLGSDGLQRRTFAGKGLASPAGLPQLAIAAALHSPLEICSTGICSANHRAEPWRGTNRGFIAPGGLKLQGREAAVPTPLATRAALSLPPLRARRDAAGPLDS
ncbi:spidroin-2-like [Hemicordylus capensis]|uniref:spidroin-2-like n=1 Tax=Hemicordylus capensis TaxID=884348 RepID=UPI002303036F|nr:spidroin-2-like [Hemicordylus capensis]